MATVKKTTKTAKATKPKTAPKVKAAAKAPAKKSAPAKKAPVAKKRARVSKKLYREVSIKKLIELFGKDGSVLCSANAVEDRQLEILKDEASKQLELDLK